MRVRRRTNLLSAMALPLAAGILAGCSTSSSEADANTASDVDSELRAMLPDDIRDAGVISFGALWETPPTIGVDPSDPSTPIGFAPDFAAEFGALLGVEVEWQNLQWPAQLPGVQSGSVDVLFGQVSITEEREKSIVDLITYRSGDFAILHAAEDEGQYARLDDMCGMSVAAPVGSTQVEYLTAASDRCADAGEPAIAVTEYQGATAAIQAMRAGTVDAWLNGVNEQEEAAATNGGEFAVFPIPNDEVPPEMSGLAIGKDSAQLTEAIHAAFARLVEDGTYDELMEEWEMTGAITAEELLINPITGTPAGETAE